MVEPGMKLRHAVAAHVGEDQYLATIGGRLLGLDKTVAELGLLSGGTVQATPGEWQCNMCHATRCWGTRNTCYRCGYPRGADGIDVQVATSPGLMVGPLERVAATRSSPVNPSYRVSTPGAGVVFSGSKGNGAGGRNPQAAGGVVEVPPLGGSSSGTQSGVQGGSFLQERYQWS